MPIVHILDTPMAFAVQHCANCGAARSHLITSLQLGMSQDLNVIELPACPCGAQEFLNRTFDEAPEHLSEHRRAVNALATHLKSKGQVHPAHVEHFATETHEPKQSRSLAGPVAPIQGMPEIVVPDGLKL